MTYKEAYENGWRDYDLTLTKGYVRRVNFDKDNAVCHEAGGRRKGLLYILEPCWKSSQYCYRRYLKKND